MSRPRIKPEEPEIDWLLALMLERKHRKNLNFDEIATSCGVSVTAVKQWFSSSPWSWSQENRKKVCDCLGITKEMRMQCYRGE